jgi:CHAT domain-containing protein
MKAQSLRGSESKGASYFQNVFRQYIEKKLQNEYEEYFKAVLKEASLNQGQNNANMREVVGIKVGLEYMKYKEIEQEKLVENKRSMDSRKKASPIYRFAIKIISSPAFTKFMTLTIVANTIILSLDRYPIV